ncbi:MAG: VCBS repeat-containing protein [Deltaproteobacteria bacterium]|nr:VCBS repeat-containing protein [Deltaproteobacteria bacterium]
MPLTTMGQPTDPAPPADENEEMDKNPERIEVAYRWEKHYYGRLEGKPGLLYTSTTSRGRLTFGDLDGDGRPDLLLGKADGRISYFRNIGTASVPKWLLIEENLRGIETQKTGEEDQRVVRVMARGKNAAPFLADIDQDKDLDLVVGAADGSLVLYRNIGNRFLPSFELDPKPIIQKELGKDLVPFLADVDGDRDLDLMVGNQRGQVYLVINQGDLRRGAFCTENYPAPPQACKFLPRVVANLGPMPNAAPAMADWNGNGFLDLFVGQKDGAIAYLKNDGNRTSPHWILVQRKFLAIDAGGYATPAFLDLNGDGRPELISGSGSHQVYVYTYKETQNPMDLYQMDNNYLEVKRLGGPISRVAIATGDVDSDGDLDMILGDAKGVLYWLENTGNKKEPSWHLAKEDLMPDPNRRNAVPMLIDLDSDGDLDLVVGNHNGRLIYFKNQGSAKKPDWRPESSALGGVDVGADSVPAFLDIDADGDLDLFVGNHKGVVVYYENQGTREEFRYVLKTTRFARAEGGKDSVPVFFFWDQDKRPDLMMGTAKGKLLLFLNLNKPDSKVPGYRDWMEKTPFWEDLWVDGHAFPHFADLNGDGRPDLLMGDEAGNITLQYNLSAKQTLRPKAGAPVVKTESEEVTPGEALPPSEDKDKKELFFAETQAAAAPPPTGPLPPEFERVEKKFGGLEWGSRIVVALADLDGDGDLDLVVGTAKGELLFYRNEGTPQLANFVKASDKFSGYDKGRNPSPVLADMDADGKPDLVVGTEDGHVYVYRNTPETPETPFTLDAEMTQGIFVGRNAQPAVADMDGDDLPDLLVGNFNGNLILYKNLGPGKKPQFSLADRRFLGIDVGLGAAPFVGDLDRDGKPDLIIGSDQGNLTLYQKTGTGKLPGGWAKNDALLKKLVFPRGTSPRLVDVDADGDVDLLVGTDGGVMYLYPNDANAQVQEAPHP